eukprot:Plantae.Rhodophyta-Hildenbrandia_rubra.ctg4146.p2 GENE.Plantae.Rhodophyta-Hildenbrandia_rubra.ctg4146~~Plantae.Rhodophyta-Hildenbrandia_rubra.ctg4146.p2  ORF type:complete len:488 (-),score=142.08 Plantae.Rhodophyta-Hildenbrandia_rubra.ctg4146:1121-2584(-)
MASINFHTSSSIPRLLRERPCQISQNSISRSYTQEPKKGAKTDSLCSKLPKNIMSSPAPTTKPSEPASELPQKRPPASDNTPPTTPPKTSKSDGAPETPSTRSKRLRRPPPKFIPTSQPRSKSNAKDIVKSGDGVALGKVPNIAYHLTKVPSKADEVLLLHRVLFNSVGVATKRKGDIRGFCGWGEEKVVDEDDVGKIESKARDKLGKAFVTVLKKVSGLLDLPTSGNKEDLVNAIVGFLKKPSVVEGRPDLTKLAQKKRKKKRKKSRTPGGVQRAMQRAMKLKAEKNEDVEMDDKESDEYSDIDMEDDEDAGADEKDAGENGAEKEEGKLKKSADGDKKVEKKKRKDTGKKLGSDPTEEEEQEDRMEQEGKAEKPVTEQKGRDDTPSVGNTMQENTNEEKKQVEGSAQVSAKQKDSATDKAVQNDNPAAKETGKVREGGSLEKDAKGDADKSAIKETGTNGEAAGSKTDQKDVTHSATKDALASKM